MTNHWIDLKNANVHLIMGSNAVENHPIASYWIWKAKEENNATIIHVDPRFTRTSAKADMYAPIRSGTDIAFLGGMIRWMIEKFYETGGPNVDPAQRGKYINQTYAEDCTNALFLVRTDFKNARTAPLGNFSASSTWDYQYNADVTDGNTTLTIRTPKKATTLDDTNCVFQHLRRQYSAYTPEMVQRICGTPAGLFEEICEAYCGGTYADDKAGTMLYAMGWTQHTVGTQNIRTATIIQSLLGNIGVAGGGVDALRGWHNVQGATDHGFLMDLLPGYLALPQATAAYAELGTGPVALSTDTATTYLQSTIPLAMDPDATAAPQSSNWWGKFPNDATGQFNRARYMVSNLKAWWPSVAPATSYHYLPKRTGDRSFLTIFDEMEKGNIKGLFCWGTNPLVMAPDQNKMRAAMKKLEWLVVCDCFETETSGFWKNPDDLSTGTEVWFLPAAYAYEKEGSASNSGRLIQWRDKACDPPGDARDEVDILNDLGAAIITAVGRTQLTTLAWPVGPLLTVGTLAEKVARECNGYALVNHSSSYQGVAYTAGQQIASFFHLDANGNTACGNWLFSGSWTQAGGNQMRKRDPIDYHPAKIGIHHNWAFSWPVNRRIIYNRAAVYQSGPNIGKPLNPSKWVVWWNGTNWNGGCGAGQVNDVVDGFGTAGPATWLPFIMREEGVARLMGKGASVVDGPLPEHWEPWETPLDANPLTVTGPLVSPYAFAYSGATYADTPAERDLYPIVCTTFRLTEHWHGGGFTRNCPTQGEAQPEPFVEMSVQLAASKGITNGDLVRVSSIRGSIDLKACVTKRWKPFLVNGSTVHEVGIPWHWGWAGMFDNKATANMLTPFIGDANTRIPETKVFLVDIELAP
jgi:formate dehydrogenase major subunit